ncbi:helix-turn-helix domain-containing protein [Paenibacillus sedimenti]|uniref:Helix-turn-helix domain-containing protein n=1 Tax=Paenibacillus sedimenti TaxID=2770274 RepID=A0A926KU06_9BACL|nr:helix-turn-helix domain-containing protein [Paenibacillus sedimenti]MBD0383283.1 hypothetical protein [Paenibacillus sedimenti]
MIINSKTVSLTEAAAMLGMSEQKILQLRQHGYLEQSKPENGKTRIIVSSLKKYASRSGKALQETLTPVVTRSGSLTIGETMTKLGLQTEAAVHKLIQAGKLKAGFEGGAYVVNAQSLHDYVTGRC